jgi:hypothetical protein
MAGPAKLPGWEVANSQDPEHGSGFCTLRGPELENVARKDVAYAPSALDPLRQRERKYEENRWLAEVPLETGGKS